VQKKVNLEESEQNEVDGIKKGADSTGKVTKKIGCSSKIKPKVMCRMSGVE